MTFSKILIAYDGSNLANKALDKAIELAKTNPHSSLELVYVIKIPMLFIGEAYIPATTDMREAIYKDAENSLEKAGKRLSASGIPYNVQAVEGQPAKALIEFAASHQCDLIVMGSRGNSGIKEFVLGSVSHNIVQHAEIPVLIIK